MFRTLICFVALIAAGFMPVMGETAKGILDRTAAQLKGNGGIEATFEATVFRGTTPAGTTQGTVYVQGNKFKIVSAYSTTWFNGKTQWALMADNGEVYVSTPTKEELQSINPYSFVNIYKSGYNLQLTAEDYQGKNRHLVCLKAQKQGMGISEMRLLIDKTTYQLLNIRIRKDSGDWVRIRVSGMKSGNKWPAAFFGFSQSEYPDVEVVDLR